MNTLTPSLSIIILTATVAPTSLSYSLGSVWRRGEEPSSANYSSLILLLITLGITIASVVILVPGILTTHPMSKEYLLIAAFCAALCTGLEYLIVSFVLFLSTGNRGSSMTLHDYWERAPLLLLCLTLLISVGEEIVYRLFWFEILQNRFGFSVLATVVVSGVCYSLNHLFFGFANVLSKAVCGIIYGTLYVLSGYAIAVPILTHILHNLFLLLLTHTRSRHA